GGGAELRRGLPLERRDRGAEDEASGVDDLEQRSLRAGHELGPLALQLHQGNGHGGAGYPPPAGARAPQATPPFGGYRIEMGSASDQFAALRRIAGLVDAPATFLELA